MRRKVIAGNWKMNMLPNEAMAMITELEPLVKDTKNEVILCVPFTDLFYCLNVAQGTNIKIGAQNMHFEEKGAFTGEVSGKMLKSIGVEYVIIGHSERRQYFAETDETVNKKIKAAFANELNPIVCVGETLEQREAGETVNVITSQIHNAFEGLEAKDLDNIVVAYEPIWAIGTGKTASSEEANDAIKEIRNQIEKDFSTGDISILYGGSVKPENAKELFTTSDIDGGLVGGASLKADVFSKIVNYDKE
jgi:triosephosphate isomerase